MNQVDRPGQWAFEMLPCNKRFRMLVRGKYVLDGKTGEPVVYDWPRGLGRAALDVEARRLVDLGEALARD